MNSKLLQRTGIFSGAFALALLLACKPANDTTAQQSTPPAPPAAEAAKPAAPAAGMVRYDAETTGSKMKIEGTSTIHDWSMEGVIVGGFLEADPKFPESALTDPQAAKPKCSVFIPVRSLKSNSGAMDTRMQTTMNEAKYKRIEYKLIELKPKSAAGATGPLLFDAVGALTIAGTTRTNTMTVTIAKPEPTKIKISGTVKMKMTDHNVEPPALTIAGIGLKTGDDITLTFDWLLGKKAQ